MFFGKLADAAKHATPASATVVLGGPEHARGLEFWLVFLVFDRLGATFVPFRLFESTLARQGPRKCLRFQGLRVRQPRRPTRP